MKLARELEMLTLGKNSWAQVNSGHPTERGNVGYEGKVEIETVGKGGGTAHHAKLV